MSGEWLSMNEAAAMLGRSDKLVRGMIKAGELEGELVTTDRGRQWRISAASVARAASGTPSGTAPEPIRPHPADAPEGSSFERESVPEPHPVPLPEASGAQIVAVAGEVHQLRGEIEQLKAFIAGGAMQAISERLASLPDADAVAAAVRDAVGAALAERDAQRADAAPAATQSDVAAAVEAAESAAAVREQKLLDALASVRGELQELRENPPRRGFFARLFGG